MNPSTEHDHQKCLTKMQDLLSINIDSQRGFEEAAGAAQDPQLKSLFTEFGQKRAFNASELRQYLASAGEEPSNSGSVSGALHRWWIDAKHALGGADSTGILSEAERGEDAIKHQYEGALKDLHDAPVREIIERQYRNVRESHDRIKALRDSYKARDPRG